LSILLYEAPHVNFFNNHFATLTNLHKFSIRRELILADSGKLLVRTFISTAQLPVSGATVIVSVPRDDGRQELVSIRMTNQNGLAGPIELEAPDAAGSQTPGSRDPVFSSYTLVLEHPDFQLAAFDKLQIFSGVETVQDVPLIPLSANGTDRQDLTTVTPQPL
jgi:hypothetical protein